MRKLNSFSLLHDLPRLMVNLTQPALLCFGSMPKEPSFRHHFLQVLAYLQAYKEVRFYPRVPGAELGAVGKEKVEAT